MKKFATYLVFLVLVLEDFIGLNLGIAPGLSAKNVVLYCLVIWIVFDAVLDSQILYRQIDYLTLHILFIVLIIAAVFSVIVRIFVLPYENYGIMYGAISLKSFLIDQYLLLFVFVAAIKSSSEALWIVKAMLITLTIANVISLIDMFNVLELNIMMPRGDGRLEGPLGSSNAYGALMAFYIPTLIAFAYSSSGFSRIRWAFAGLIFLVVMAFTASRGAFVGMCAGAVPGLYLLRRYIRAKYVVQVASLVVAFAAVAFSLLAIQYGELLYTRFIEQSASSSTFEQTSGRTDIWSDALMLMANKPVSFLVGFGWKTFSPMNGIASHNGYLEYFFNLGIIGLTLIVFIYSNILYRLIAALEYLTSGSRLLVMGCVFGFLSILVSTMFTNLLAPWLFIWAYVGAILRFVCDQQSPGAEKGA